MGFAPKLCSRIAVVCALLGGAVLFSAFSAPPAAAADTTQILKSIPFAENAQVPPAVRDQCQLQTKVPEFIAQAAAGSVTAVDGPLDKKKGRALELTITEVHAPGGGAFSGPKWMSVSGTLYEKGKQIGSFRAKRYSTGGAFGGFKGTCSIIGRCTKAIGDDIAAWLGAPTQNATLGDAQ